MLYPAQAVSRSAHPHSLFHLSDSQRRPGAPEPSEALPEAAPSREPLTWDNLPQRYGRYLRGWARRKLRQQRMTPSKDRLDEIVQDTYCRVFQANGHGLVLLNQLQESERRDYLKKAVLSATIDTIRRELALKRGVKITERLGVSAEQEISDDRTEDSNPETQAAARVTIGHLLAHLYLQSGAGSARQGRSGLGTRTNRTPTNGARTNGARTNGAQSRLHRNLAIFFLAVAWGWTSREIAQLTRVPLTASAVDSVVHRMRRRLRKACCESATLGVAGLSAASPPRTPRACAPWDRTS